MTPELDGARWNWSTGIGISRRRFVMAAAMTGAANLAWARLLPKEEKSVFTGEVRNWKSVQGLKGFEVAFQFLERSDLRELPLGRHTIEGENVYALITKSQTRTPESAQFEAHRKYIDVHCLISGQEIIGSLPTSALKLVVSYDSSKDVELFAVPSEYAKLEMRPGRFAVFSPGQAHLPTCHFEGPHELHKVVIKVSVEYQRARA